MIKDLGLEDSIKLFGKSTRVPEILKMSDGKILPTSNTGRREGFGAALVEAMAAGLPVIATKSGGPEDIVQNGQNGWLVEADSVSELADAMSDFYLNRDKRIEFGKNAWKRAQEEYGTDLMIERYSGVYKSLFDR